MASGELQGWYRDPFGLHEKRYMSAGRPTKLVRDGHVESYDEPPSSTYEMAADTAGERDFAPGGAATSGGYTVAAPRQAHLGDDLRFPDPAPWSPWRWYGRAIMIVVAVTAGAILAVMAFGGSAQPAWAKSLGAGVTVDAPAPASPGHGSPGAAVSGFFAAIEAKNVAALCEYASPGFQALCTQMPASAAAVLSILPSVRNIALGYTAIDGDMALVGTTGTFCPSAAMGRSECYTNEDPAAIFSGGKPFSTLWTETSNTSGDTYWLAPCIKTGGNWYVYIPPS